MDPEFVQSIGALAIETAKNHPGAIGWIVLAMLAFTTINTFVGTWRRIQGPEKAAMASTNLFLRGIGKISSALGWAPVKVIDGLVYVWCAAMNTIARARHVPIPYPPEDRAIVISEPGAPPEVVVVDPVAKRTLHATVESDLQAAARAESDFERANAVNKEERIR